MAQRANLDSVDAGQASIPLRRLLAYQDAVAKLRALNASNGPNITPLGTLLESLADVPRDLLVSDLRLLGSLDTRAIDLGRLDGLLASELWAHTTRKLDPEVSFGLLDPDSLVQVLSDEKTQSVSRAQARERALEVTSDHRMLGLGRLNNDRSAYRHQIQTARRIVEQMLGCGMVADEVGLGKTITGVLILLELIERGLVSTSLILVPSNLLTQWAEELKDFFDFEPAIISRKDRLGLEKARFAQHLLLDLDKAKANPFNTVLLERSWDCLIIDEAHRIRNHNTARSRFSYSLKSTYRVQLTATPVHNSAFDAYSQVTNLRPGALGHRDAYREMHVCEDGSIYNPEFLQKLLEETISRTRRAGTDLRFAERKIVPVMVKKRPVLERQLYSDLLNFLRTIYRRHSKGAVPITTPLLTERHVEPWVLVSTLVLRELGSHPRAALKTVGGSLRRDIEKLAKLTRDYVDLEALDELIERYEETDWTVGNHAKTEALVKNLSRMMAGRVRHVIVYTEFIETLRALKERIEADLSQEGHEFDLIVYHGGLPSEAKGHALRRFRDESRSKILLSTDCGGEGLNLQVADTVMNYDFPWNPMRIEQRIGRIDRIRQESPEIHIHNFITEGTFEVYVYAVLEEKLDVCTEVLGAFASPITRLMLRRPEDLGIGEMILSCENDEQMAERFESFKDDIDVFLRKQAQKSGSREDQWF
jgi:SNF2 family DNA or RNA helicase